MHPFNWQTLTLVVLVVAFGNSSAEPFPPPDALEWHEFEEVHVKIRAPKGWSHQSKSNGDTQAFFVSRDALVEGGEFQSGVSLNVVSFPEDAPQGALSYATSFAVSYPKKFGPGAECGVKEGAPLTLFWCQADLEEGGHTTTALHHLAANSETGKLYIFMFESLRQDWQQSWSTITTMLKSIDIDPSY